MQFCFVIFYEIFKKHYFFIKKFKNILNIIIEINKVIKKHTSEDKKTLNIIIDKPNYFNI